MMMILDVWKRPVLLCILFGLSGISALARVDNWSQRRPNNTFVAQNHSGQAGYRPAVGFQQPLPQTQWNRNNQTQGRQPQPQPQWQQPNNRTQYNYQPSAPQANQNPWIRNNNQSQFYPPQPIHGQGSYNRTQYNYPPSAPQANQNPWIRNNQTQFYPAQPIPGQGSYNTQNNSHLYPKLPNNHQNIPGLPSNSWSPPANQTHVYPQIPNIPVQPNAVSNGSPLAPLQPQNGQSALSYGPGHYPQPAGNPNNRPPVQGSSNPYANMFH